MGLAKVLDEKTYAANVWIRKCLVRHSENINIRKKANLIKKITLSKSQKREINDFFKKNYGKKIPFVWHRLYQSYTGNYHVNYFPEKIFSTELEPLTNPYRIAEVFGDKNLIGVLFSGVDGLHIPETYISCVNGILRNGENKIIDIIDAEKIVRGLKSFVIKKTCETSSGRDVHVYDGDEDPFKLLTQFGMNFIIQEKIKQHESLKILNPSSVNTFRIITYLCENKLYMSPVALRMGRSSADRDNIHYGGVCIGVDTDSCILRDTAFSEYGESYYKHPDTGVKFSGHKIPLRCLLETTLKMHSLIPYLGIISWDMTVDQMGKPTIVEMNTTGQSAWFCQMVNGEPLFGDNTEKMLGLIKTKIS